MRGHAAGAAVLTAFLLLGVGAPAGAKKSTQSVAHVAAQRSLQQGIGALISRDFATASRALAESFRLSPQPELLYYLGALAQAEARTLDAQDLMRRYLSDPHQEAAAESAEQKEAERIVELRRPPHGKLQVLGEAGTLVSIDGRLVGDLPLSQPLLLSPGTHKVALQLRGQQHEESVAIQVGRFVQMSYSADTSSVLLAVVPVLLLLDDYQGPVVDSQKQVAGAIDRTLHSEHYSPLRRAEALAGARDSSLASCLGTLACQAQLARENGADFALRVTEGAADSGRKIVLELLHATVGEIAARAETSCPRGCTADDATALLQRTLPALLVEAKQRQFGRMAIDSKPSGAEVWSAGQRLGLTPLSQARWMGP